MSELKTDLNVNPYFDDYDEDKLFYRILFRPAVAVQARELTQLQTILQNQISRFGDHIFKDGSIVSGCGITIVPKIPFVRVEDSFNTNTSIALSQIDNTYLLTNSTNSNNAVRAKISIPTSNTTGYVSDYPNTNRFYLNYIRTGKDGSNNDVAEFGSGDTIYIYNSNQSELGALVANNLFDSIDVLTTNATVNATGYGYGVSVSDGIVYQKGFFAKVEPHTILVKPYDLSPNGYVVGFQTTETIVNEAQDTSLNDNAAGFSNFNAPGARRLKLSSTLTAKDRTTVDADNDFFAILEFDNDSPVEQKGDAVYNKLGEEFARRTAEESGDYVVKPFQVDTYASGNSSTMFYEVSPGIVYVNGYRVELIGSRRVEVDRATTTEVVQNQVVTVNYGNYVVVDEVVGVANFAALSEVTIYDAAQDSITDIEGSTGSPSGSIVGYANVRTVIYDNGTKGKPNCQYLVYLFNIRMNSGKSFETNAKSLYSTGTYGVFKADIVLESSKAVLKDGARNLLVFDTGVDGVRRLTNNTGVNDTSYVYRQIASATLQTNGSVTFTTNPPAAGASERLNYSVGALSNQNELEFDIVLSANAYSANLTGTVTVTSGNTTVVGSSTLFQSQLVANDFIRIGAGAALYRVTAIASNTSLTIAQTPGASYSANVFQKYFQAGSPLDLASNGGITILSNTQFTVSSGFTFDSGTQIVYGSYPVQRTTAVAISKAINKNRLVKIDCSNNATGVAGPWDLGLVDVAKINAIYVGASYANTNPDRSSWFILDNGQRDDSYDHGKLFIKPAYASNITSSSRILVDLDHFVANTSAGKGFFSVDSYPVSNTANSTTISYAQIPYYKGIDLRNAIDVRPVKFNTANSVANTNPANTQITVNPVVSNSSFNVVTAQYMPEVDSNIEADVEFYLPRYDLLVMNKEGDLFTRSGSPAITPLIPFNEADATQIAQVYVPPFPSLTVREGEALGRKDISTKIDIKTNRRYTMADIGALEQRIKRLEYYTVLNAIEQKARDLTIPDSSGLNRFKNGIFADPFNSHEIGNVADFEYNISIDKDLSVGRPYFKSHPVDFRYETSLSSGVVKTGSLITLPYTNELYITQRFATKVRNATESVWNWNGKLNLYPSYDYYRDEVVAPNQVVNLDFSSPWEQFANSPFGTTYGDWRDVSSTSATSAQAVAGGTAVTNTTNTTQDRIISTLSVDTQTESYNLNAYVTDFSIQPYMRSRVVAFVAYGLKPNTTIHAFFDDTNVDQYVAPGVLSNVANVESGKENEVVNQNGAYGATLVTNSSGFVCGLFKIPAETFRVGDRQFRLADVDNLVTGGDAILMTARATYSASNLSVTKQGITLNTINPELRVNSVKDTRVLTTTDTTFIPAPGGGGDSGGGESGGNAGDTGDDPIAQSFFASVPSSASGMFITRFGIFFQSKDPTLGVTLYVVEMRGGFPDFSNVVGSSYLGSSSITVSSDASVETIFALKEPVFLTSNKQYAFIIQPDGASPNYRLWVGETGGRDVATDEQVYSNPYSGIMFISANRSSWTPVQKEDIKFNIYRARFTTGSGTAVFNNEFDEYLTVDGFTRANSSIAVEVGDVVYTINSSSNSTITSNGAPFGIIQYIDESNGKVYLDSSTGGFSNTTNPKVAIYRVPDNSNTGLIVANNLIATGNIATVDDLKYHLVVPKFSTLEPLRTQLTFGFKGTDDSFNTDAAYKPVTNGLEYEYLDTERVAASYSNEITYNTGDKTSFFQATLFSENDLVSPVIDLRKKSSLFIENIINNDDTNEHTKYGNALSRYVSKNVVLADGQEAEDILVYMTAYRPVNTDVKVYVKFLNPTDPETFDSKVWTELQYDDGGDFVYSSPLNVKDYVEYKLSVPSTNAVATGAFANSSTGIVEYTNAAGSRMVGYKTFAIKLVLLSSNPVSVPRLNDVRAIALQV